MVIELVSEWLVTMLSSLDSEFETSLELDQIDSHQVIDYECYLETCSWTCVWQIVLLLWRPNPNRNYHRDRYFDVWLLRATVLCILRMVALGQIRDTLYREVFHAKPTVCLSRQTFWAFLHVSCDRCLLPNHDVMDFCHYHASYQDLAMEAFSCGNRSAWSPVMSYRHVSTVHNLYVRLAKCTEPFQWCLCSLRMEYDHDRQLLKLSIKLTNSTV